MEENILQMETPISSLEKPSSLSLTRSAADGVYRVGTLQYTKAGLVVLFVWLLWGDFCFTLMETVLPSILPLTLKNLQASNLAISLLVSTIPSILNFIINPIVSFRSDRHRGRWGRRIPFLFWPTPLLSLFLVLMGFSPAIGRFLHGSVISRFSVISPTLVILVTIGVLMVCFQICNMFVGSVYYYLFNDVVPEQFLGRFMALFRMVGAGAGSLYNIFLYKHALTHMQEIFLGAAGLYFLAFMVMCWRVKEGEYPPPPATVANRTGFWVSLRTYCRECFSHRFYLYFFLGTSLWSMAGTIGMFGVFLSLSLGLTLEQLGQIGGWAGVAGMILLYPAGILSDRYHPLRVTIATQLLLTFIFTPLAMIYLFYTFSPHTVLWITIISTGISLPIGTLFGAANLPMYMMLLPKERYGQFCSAQAMFNSVALIVGSLAAGGFMDLLKYLYHGSDFYYRYIPCWSFFFQSISVIFMLLLYRSWVKYGGKEYFVPPAVGISPASNEMSLSGPIES